MLKYVKLLKDHKQRVSYNEKKYRKDVLSFILGKKSDNSRKYSFKNYCFINTNPRSVYSRFLMSRWMFKKYVSAGHFPGIKHGW